MTDGHGSTVATDTEYSQRTDTVHTSREELTATDVLQLLDRGARIAISLGLAEGTVQATVREKAATYYCDTSTKLLTHETEVGLVNCLEQHRLVRTERASVGSFSDPAV